MSHVKTEYTQLQIWNQQNASLWEITLRPCIVWLLWSTSDDQWWSLYSWLVWHIRYARGIRPKIPAPLIRLWRRSWSTWTTGCLRLGSSPLNDQFMRRLGGSLRSPTTVRIPPFILVGIKIDVRVYSRIIDKLAKKQSEVSQWGDGGGACQGSWSCEILGVQRPYTERSRKYFWWGPGVSKMY